MAEQVGKVISVHVGAEGTLEKVAQERVEVALDGIVGDRHQGLSRAAYGGDKQPKGTTRRNERMWSAISVEEMAAMGEAMDLAEPLDASSLGVNFCFEGIADLSRLPRGTILTFSSGVVLMVEEYNPPCSGMGQKQAQLHTTLSGEALNDNAFSQASKFMRGLVGVVELAGSVSVGDEVRVEPERLPKWLREPAAAR